MKPEDFIKHNVEQELQARGFSTGEIQRAQSAAVHHYRHIAMFKKGVYQECMERALQCLGSKAKKRRKAA